MSGGLFSRSQSARAAQIAATWRGLIPSQQGPRDWSPPGPGARPARQRNLRPQPERMPASQRIANYARGGRAALTGRQARRVMSKAGITRREVFALHAAIICPAEAPLPPRGVKVAATSLV